MKNIKITILSIFLAATTLLVSCESFSEGVNKNPNAFSESSVAGDLIIGQSMLAAVKLSSSQASRIGAIFVDHLGGCDRQFVSYETYGINEAGFNDIWRDLYIQGLAQAKVVEEKSEDGTILQGIAKLLLGFHFAEAAALWGDVPFSEINDPIEFPNPSYESQATVLAGAQTLLDDAITAVGDAKVSQYGSSIFKDNGATWKKVAHSLKARYYLVAKDYTNALTHAKQGIYASAANDLLSLHTATDFKENLYYQFIVKERNDYLGLCNEPHLMELLNGTITRKLPGGAGDAKLLDYYYAPGPTAASARTINTDDGGVFGKTTSFPIVSYIETKLIEAECEQRAGNDTNAQGALNAVRKYLTIKFGATFPATTATGSLLLKQILEEKYVTLIGSLQVYHDVRRTGNLIGVPVKNTTNPTIPLRFLYPGEERAANTSFPSTNSFFDNTPVNRP